MPGQQQGHAHAAQHGVHHKQGHYPTAYPPGHYDYNYRAHSSEESNRKRLDYDSKVLDIKYALDTNHRYDGNEKTGEAWRVNTRDFLLGRIFAIKGFLLWAEEHGVQEVREENVWQTGRR